MKASRFNIIVGLNDSTYVAYNSFSNALALLEQDDYYFLCNCHFENIIEIDDEIMQKMKAGHFIIDDDENEIDLIRERMLRARYSVYTLGLTIAPTLDCNFKCSYCYEKDRRVHSCMGNKVQDSIVQFVEEAADTIGKIDITWYGGEPLLQLGIIEELSEKFMKICSYKIIDYNMSIITNGYLLTKNVAEHLKKIGISHCQITIDGSREEHNKRRIHIHGDDTYDTILDNACVASKMFQVAIRVNTDRNNKDAVYHVREQINRRGGEKIIVYPAPIRSELNCYSEDDCLKNEEYMDIENAFYVLGEDPFLCIEKYPHLQGNSCCADSINSFVIAPNGDLYKCWSDIGQVEKCVGNVVARYFKESKMIMYSRYDPTRDDKCMACCFLPICMGGCPRNVNKEMEERCLYHRDSFEKYLQSLAAAIQKLDKKESI